MRENPLELRLEALGDAGAFDVEALQVAVEELARAVHRAARLDVELAARLVAAQLGQVGEDGEQFQFALDRAVAQFGARCQVRREEALALGGVDVEAEQQAQQVLEAALDAVGRGHIRGRRRQVDLDGLLGLLGGRLVAVGEGFEAHQRGAGFDLAAHRNREFANPGAERRAQHRLHLHALQHEDRGVRLDLVADGQRRRDHQRGRGGAQHAALVAADAVRDTVHLDQMGRPVRVGDEPETPAVDQDPAGVLVEPVQFRVDARSVSDADAEPARARLRDGHPVARAAELEVDRPAAIVLDLRAAAVRGGQQALLLDERLVLVCLDRGRGQRDAGMLGRDQPALCADPVDPAGVRAGVDHLGLVEQVEQEAFVGGAALDDHRGLGDRAAQPAQRLVAGAAVGDDLGDH